MNKQKLEALNKFQKPEPVGKLTPYVNLFFFGTHGAWKTTTACQIGAHRGRVLLHTADDDWKSLLNHPEIMRNVDVVPIESPLQTKLIAEALRHQIPPYDQYATFVLDTLGGWVEEFIESLLKHVSYTDKGARSRIIGKTSEGNTLIREMDLVATEYTDYNLAKAQLRPIVRDLIRAPVNVIFNSHDRVAEQDKGINWKHIRPDMPEQCFTTAVRKCDALGFFKKDGDVPTITFKDARNVTTKSRLGPLYGKEVTAPKAVELINNFMERIETDE